MYFKDTKHIYMSMIVQDFLFRKCQYNSFIKQSTQYDLHIKTIKLGTTMYLSWMWDGCLATFGFIKIDVEQVLIDPFRVSENRQTLRSWEAELHVVLPSSKLYQS